ncbi:hypothetical protein ACHWGL_31110, partial [Klebsiella pneumoniae]|uniref:hypothetical protein n=1 Tax=Klebsiella pneumoniae TaxID=573 RepID=UPI00376F1527
RVLSSETYEGGKVRRSTTVLDYIFDGAVYKQEYYEYVNNLIVDPDTGQLRDPGMHFILGGQSMASFVLNGATPDISDWSTYDQTVQGIRHWRGN